MFSGIAWGETAVARPPLNPVLAPLDKTPQGAPSTSDIAPSSSWRPPGHQSTGLDQSTGTLAVLGRERCPSLETWTWPLWRRKHAQTPQAAEGWHLRAPGSSGHGCPHPTPPPPPLACWCLLPVMLTADQSFLPLSPVRPALDPGPEALPASQVSVRSHLLPKPAALLKKCLHTYELILLCLVMRSSVEQGEFAKLFRVTLT